MCLKALIERMTKVKQITRIAYKVPPTGFSTFDVEYYLSTSTTGLAGGSWQTTPPAWVEGRYMWTRTKVVKTDGTTTYSDPACIGGTGRGVRSIQEQYYLSTSNTTQTDGSWANSPQDWADGKYMWTRSVITYTDGTTVTTDPVCVTGGKGATGQSVFKSIVFRRVNASSVSAPSGGSYASPVPTTTGWSDGIPSGTAQLWMSTRIFTSDGQSPQQSAWTTPQPATDTAGIDFEYSSVESNPGTPTTSPSNWHDSPTSADIWMAVRISSNGVWGAWEVLKVKGEKGDPGNDGNDGRDGNDGHDGNDGADGKSFVPVYRNLDVTPAKPTGASLPPLGWREDVANSVTINSIERSELSSWSFNLETQEVEYGLQYYALPGAGNDSVDSVAVINFTTNKANQQLCIELIASSEANYDCIMVGQPDAETLPVRTNASTYLAKASGNNVKAVANVIITTAGTHTIFVAYRKDSSTTQFSDFGYFRIAELPETLWMSIATMQGSTVLSWSDPIKMTAGKGERGAIPRMRDFAEGLLFMEGKAGEAYLDFAFYNNRYYRCTKTHIAQVGETPYAAVQAANGLWALETDYQFLASKVVWVGSGSEGWLIDGGRIYHSSGLIELNANGTIQTSNGKFSLDKNGNINAQSGTFAGFLKMPFKSFAEGATYLGNGVYRVSDNFNLYSEGNMNGYDIGLQLPNDPSFSGTLLTVYDFPVKTRSSPLLTITCQSGAQIYHPSSKGTYGLTPVSSIVCNRGGLIQLLCVDTWGTGSDCSWMVVTDIMPDATIS